ILRGSAVNTNCTMPEPDGQALAEVRRCDHDRHWYSELRSAGARRKNRTGSGTSYACVAETRQLRRVHNVFNTKSPANQVGLFVCPERMSGTTKQFCTLSSEAQNKTI